LTFYLQLLGKISPVILLRLRHAISDPTLDIRVEGLSQTQLTFLPKNLFIPVCSISSWLVLIYKMGSIIDSKTSTSAVRLSVIDVSDPSAETGKQLLAAATKYGFLYINTKGTGFTEALVNREFELSKEVFALSTEEKDECHISKNNANRGWTGMHNETLDPKNQRKGDFKEAFNIGEFTADGNAQQPLPRALSDHEDELWEFEKLCKSTCNKVLDLLAMGLEVEEPKFFSSRHTSPSGCTVRLLHYPSIPDDVDYQPEVDIRAGAHSDCKFCH
jgi:isopenicillin N synthase-like dioxygenase